MDDASRKTQNFVFQRYTNWKWFLKRDIHTNELFFGFMSKQWWRNKQTEPPSAPDAEALQRLLESPQRIRHLHRSRLGSAQSSDSPARRPSLDTSEPSAASSLPRPPLVHRDLKSRNVLLSGEMQAKLTDFGVSRYQSDQHPMTAARCSVVRMASEVKPPREQSKSAITKNCASKIAHQKLRTNNEEGNTMNDRLSKMWLIPK